MKAFDDGYSIQAVSRQSGVHPVTLRAWERRYGLIRPARTGHGHRYSDQDLAVIEQILSLDRVCRSARCARCWSRAAPR